MFGVFLNKYEWFSPSGVVGCGSETHLRVGENFSYLLEKDKGWRTEIFLYKPREQRVIFNLKLSLMS